MARTVFLTLLIGAAGAVLGWALSVPAPFLTGPAALVTLASLRGVPTHVPTPLRDTCFVVIGIGMGTGISPEVLQAALHWPISLLALFLAMLVVFFGGAALVQRMFGFDRNTGRLAATPGHLSFILSLSTDIRADMAVVSVIQSLRVLVLTLLVPVVALILTGADLDMTHIPGAPMPFPSLAAVAALAVAIGWALRRARAPAAFLLAGLLCSAAGHGSGLTPGVVPAWVAIPAFAVMGTLIGTRFAGVTPVMLRRVAAASAILTGLALLASIAAALAVNTALGFPVIDLLIAFAPGGLETMAALAIMLEADPAFVALHHAWRILILSFLVPAFVTWEPPSR